MGYYYNPYPKDHESYKWQTNWTSAKFTKTDKTEFDYAKPPVTSEIIKHQVDMWKDGKLNEFSTPIYLPLFMQEKFLIPNMELDIEITPHTEQFTMIAPSTYTGEVKLELMSIRLYVPYVHLLPGVALELEKKLMTTKAKYCMERFEVKSFTYNEGWTDAHTLLSVEGMPKAAIAGMVLNSAKQGNLHEDPEDFRDFGIRNLSFKGANATVPSHPWDVDFEHGRFIRAFDHLHRVTSKRNDFDCGINREMFRAGYTLFPMILTTTGEDNINIFDFMRDGPLIFEAKFNKPLAKPIHIIFVLIHQMIMYVAQDRTIRTDLTT